MNTWLAEYRVAAVVVVGLFIALGVGAFALKWQPAAEIVIQPPPPTATPSPVRVYVSGAVVNPDVYTLDADSISQDALNAAGGATEDADLERVNLAQSLQEGQHLHFPHVGEPSTSDTVDAGISGPVNINTATQEELEALPGIGPALAERIVAYRQENGPFEQIEDIQNVSGIGGATFENIRDQITVGN